MGGLDHFNLSTIAQAVSSRCGRNWPLIKPTVGKFCTPTKQGFFNSMKKGDIFRK
jgi:hypothetical protein